MNVLFWIEKKLKEISKKLDNKWVVLIILLLITLISSLIIFDSGILKGHDIEYHLSRIKGIKENLQGGNILALIHNGFNGYGYPNGLFYSNLFLYFPALLNLLGMNIINSYKVFLIVCTFFTSLSMYYCVKKITDDNGKALLSSLIYTASSYRICDVFVRAAVGEVLSFIFIPMVILGLYEIIKGNYKNYFIFSLAFVALINCHMISTIIMFIVSLIIIALNYKDILSDTKRIKALIFSTILGLGVGAFFIFPFLEQYLTAELLINSGTSEISITMPFEKIFFGIPNYTTRFLPGGIGLIYFFVLYLRFKLKSKNEIIKFSDQSLFIGFLSLILCTDLVPWKELSPVFGFMQFSWRLLFVSTTFLSFSSGIIITEYLKKNDLKYLGKSIIVLYIIFICIVNQGLSYLSIKTYYSDVIEKIYDYDSFSIAAGEYLPAKTDWSLIDLDERKCRTNSGDIIINYEQINGKNYISYKNNLSQDTYIEVPLLYYKGYVANSEKNYKYDLSQGYNTWVKINIGNKNEDKIFLNYEGTAILKISYIISILSITGFVILKHKDKVI